MSQILWYGVTNWYWARPVTTVVWNSTGTREVTTTVHWNSNGTREVTTTVHWNSNGTREAMVWHCRTGWSVDGHHQGEARLRHELEDDFTTVAWLLAYMHNTVSCVHGNKGVSVWYLSRSKLCQHFGKTLTQPGSQTACLHIQHLSQAYTW